MTELRRFNVVPRIIGADMNAEFEAADEGQWVQADGAVTRVRELEQELERMKQIERAHSRAVDKISDLIARIQLRETDLAERGSQKAAFEQESIQLKDKIKGMRGAYDRASQSLHDAGLKLTALEAENARLRR